LTFFYRYKCPSIDIYAHGEGMEGLIFAVQTLILSFIF
jgi:hypothetical protein